MPPKKGDYVIKKTKGNRTYAYQIKSTRGSKAILIDSSGKTHSVSKSELTEGHPTKYRKTKTRFWEL